MWQQLVKDQQLQENEAKKIVSLIFPKKNFFAFKKFPLKEKNKKNKELEEIIRINKEAIDHGSYRIINLESSHLLPVVMSNDCRD